MAEISGQTTVSTAGTAVRLHNDLAVNGALMIKALPGNTGILYIGNANGDVDSASGLPLAAGDVIVMDYTGNLRELWVDASVSGEKVAWLLLSA